MTKIYDYHIHTEFSSCSRKWGPYSFSDVWNKINELGLDGFGTADHYNYHSYKKSFIHRQKETQKELGLDDNRKGLVGLEISISNRKGDLGVPKKLLDTLDYKIISEHVHVAKIFSGYFTFKKRFLSYIKDYQKNKMKIKEMLKDILVMQLAAIPKYPHSIYAHILRSPRSWGYYFNDYEEMLEQLLEQLQSAEMALELHGSFITMWNFTEEQAEQNWKGGDHEMNGKEFVKILFKKAKNYDLFYSLGSDAHQLKNLISKNEWEKFIDQIGIPKNRLIGPEFFEK